MGLVMPYGFVNAASIGYGDDLLPDGSNPLPQLMLSLVVHQSLIHPFQWNLNQVSNILFRGNMFENFIWKMAAMLFSGH